VGFLKLTTGGGDVGLTCLIGVGQPPSTLFSFFGPAGAWQLPPTQPCFLFA
jgi:hypothetical protein